MALDHPRPAQHLRFLGSFEGDSFIRNFFGTRIRDAEDETVEPTRVNVRPRGEVQHVRAWLVEDGHKVVHPPIR